MPIVILMIACVSCYAQTTEKQFENAEPEIKLRLDSVGDPLPDSARWRLGTLRFRHAGPVLDMALSPDDKTVLTIGQNDELAAWDSQTGKQLWRRLVTDGPMTAYGVRSFAFPADGKSVYTFSEPNVIDGWELADGAPFAIDIDHNLPMTAKNRPIGALPGTTRSIDVTRDGTRIAAAGAHGVVVLDAKGKHLFEFANSPKESMDELRLTSDRLTYGGHYSLAVFSPDGKTLAIVTSESPELIRIYDAEHGNELKLIKLSGRLVRMTYSPNGQSIATTEQKCAIRQYSTATGECEWENTLAPSGRFESYTSAIAYSPDGNQVAACAPIGNNHWIYVLNGSSGKVDGVLKGHMDKPWAVAFTSDSKALYSSGWDGSIRRWDLESFKQLRLPLGTLGTPVIAASPSGPETAYADALGIVQVVNAVTGLEQTRFECLGNCFSQLIFSADGRLLAGGGDNETDVFVTVWEIESKRVLQHWQWPKGEDPRSTVGAIEFSPNRQRLVVAVPGQYRGLMWDVLTGKQVAEMPHEDLRGLSYSPDGMSLVTGGWDQQLCFWNGETGALIQKHTFKQDESTPQDLRMHGIRFSPNGDSIATANLDGMVRIWSQNDFSLKTKIQMKSGFDHGALSYSPNGKWLATGTVNEVSIFDPQSGDLMWSTVAHRGATYAVGFGDNGRTLVSGGDDGVGYCLNFIPSQSTGEPNYDSLWQDLATTNATTARNAIWAMIQIGDPAVAEVERRLAAVRFILDFQRITKGLEPNEAANRLRLAKHLCDTDPKAITQSRLHNALTFVARLNTPVAIACLQQLARKHVCKDVQREAASMLSEEELRLRRSEEK